MCFHVLPKFGHWPLDYPCEVMHAITTHVALSHEMLILIIAKTTSKLIKSAFNEEKQQNTSTISMYVKLPTPAFAHIWY